MAQFMISLSISVILFLSFMQPEAIFSLSTYHLCHPHEALSLLQFKEEMLDINSSIDISSNTCDESGQYSYPKMIFWNKTSSDCCTWDGVVCHNITSHVIGLDLSCSRLRGVVRQNSTLFLLSQLQKLNLAHNDFNSSEISPNFGGLTFLTHLNLSSTFLQGLIPQKISHLSKLVLLDLSDNDLLGFSPGDFQILLRNLTYLRVLSLRGMDMSTTSLVNWSSSLTHLDLGYTGVNGKFSNSFFHLPRLQTLRLKDNEHLTVGLPKRNCTNCLLDGIPDFIYSFASLKYLDLSNCGLTGSFSNSIGNLSQIVQLDLSKNNFTGNISLIISNFPKSSILDLRYNSFTGQFPSYVGNLTELTMLALEYNFLSGPLPSNMSGLRRLRSLSLSYNAFDGTIPSSLFSLPLLTSLSLDHNRFTGQIKEFLPRSLGYLNFGSNQLDGLIPYSISQLVNLSYLELSSNNLSGSIEFKMFSNLNHLQFLLLSNNKLSLKFENKINISFPNLFVLGLSSCEINEFPHFLKNSKNLAYLELSNNKLNGQIPNWIPWDSLRFLNLSHNSLSTLGSPNTPLPLIKNLLVLDLRSNKFQEPLSLSICSFEVLYILDLSHNNFTGTIPKCFGNFISGLEVLNLAKNNLKGAISVTFPKDSQLVNMNLNGNLFEGPLPRSLANCKSLKVLDLGDNEINDTFPTFLENLTELQVLILRSNKFSGSISNFKNENFLPKLRVFDLSCNEFTGALPFELLKSFKAMITLDRIEPKGSYMGVDSGDYQYPYLYSMSWVTKGHAVDFAKILTNLVLIDLSRNNLTGYILEIIGNLSSLVVLNLSHNKFSGRIPSALGELYFLESLDLSWNQIEGEIPLQLIDLTNLEFLNLSQNHLVGRIPEGKQFNTFLNDSYYGNLWLCGFPVTKNCGEMDRPSPPSPGSYEGEDDSCFLHGLTWKSVLIGYGFGFAIGCLVIFIGKPKWLVRNIEEVCWYGLLLLGKIEMCKKLKKSWRRGRQKGYRRNN